MANKIDWIKKKVKIIIIIIIITKQMNEFDLGLFGPLIGPDWFRSGNKYWQIACRPRNKEFITV